MQECRYLLKLHLSMLTLSAIIAISGCRGEFASPGMENAAEPDAGDVSQTRDASTPSNTSTDATSSDATDTSGGQGDVGRGDVGGEVTGATADVFERLRPTCEGCHLNGSSFPAFADLNAFVSLIVSNTQFVVAGDPDASELVRLLEANGTRQWQQMPSGNQSFEDLEAAGETQIGVAEVRHWVAALDQIATTDVDEPALVRRLTAEQILNSLYSQLGLAPSDFLQINPNSGEISNADPSRYPIHGRDMIPNIHSNGGSHAQERFEALGGPSFLLGTPRVQGFAPLFGHTLTQTAQAWCRVSVNKSGNDALFRYASRSDNSSGNPNAIKDNIRHLFLKMLAVEASAEEVDDLYTSIFLPYEAESGTETAWIAVCACMIRDPLWLTY